VRGSEAVMGSIMHVEKGHVQYAPTIR
jgi:hypothetical protein